MLLSKSIRVPQAQKLRTVAADAILTETKSTTTLAKSCQLEINWTLPSTSIIKPHLKEFRNQVEPSNQCMCVVIPTGHLPYMASRDHPPV